MGFRAYAAHEEKGPLAPFVYEPAELGSNDVEIRISHCGICHSDVHLVDGDWGASGYPMVPGHEIVGTVASAGPAVRHLAVGQRVGVGWQCGACLECEWCVSGQENLCAQEEATCVERPGGFAERIRVDGRFAFPIPDALRSEHAAPLLCGGVTVYAPLARFARPSLRVGVVGIGGLGHLALQFARAMGCEVTALSTNPAKRAEALAFGAHRFVAAGDSKALRAAAQSLDFVLSTAFLAQDWKGLLRMLRPERRAVPGRRARRVAAARRRRDARPAAHRHDERDRRAPGRARDARLRRAPRDQAHGPAAAARGGRRRPRGRAQGPGALPHRAGGLTAPGFQAARSRDRLSSNKEQPWPTGEIPLRARAVTS